MTDPHRLLGAGAWKQLNIQSRNTSTWGEGKSIKMVDKAQAGSTYRRE